MGPSCLKQKGPELNEANATPTCCCTQETAALAEHSLNNIVEPCEELPPTPNLTLPADVELEVVDLSNDPNIP